MIDAAFRYLIIPRTQFAPDTRIIVSDPMLATGGTMVACLKVRACATTAAPAPFISIRLPHHAPTCAGPQAPKQLPRHVSVASISLPVLFARSDPQWRVDVLAGAAGARRTGDQHPH